MLLILHAHLPYVREERDGLLESEWFFQAFCESYLPLYLALERVSSSASCPPLALSFSPTLTLMLDDAFLKSRLKSYVRERLGFLDKGGLSGYPDAATAPALEKEYRRLYGEARQFLEQGPGDLLGAFAELGKKGLSLGTTAASHALLPLLATEAGRRAQIRTALKGHTARFGRAADFFWLPECAYAPGLEEQLAEEGLTWAVAAESSLSSGPESGALEASLDLAGGGRFRLLKRDDAAARWVWDRHSGYPADPVYREYHRDLGFDREAKDLGPFGISGPLPRALGLKGHRVTARGLPLGEKSPYDPVAAGQRARNHAREFLEACGRLLNQDRQPYLVAAFDAELFGHWWYEGPIFLEELLTLSRKGGPVLLHPGRLPGRDTGLRSAGAGSWGREGDFSTWLNEGTAEEWGRLRRAERRLAAAALKNAGATGALRLSLDSALRALLLAQASDWTFMITQGPFREFGRNRLNAFLAKLDGILDKVEKGSVSSAQARSWAAELTIFPQADFRDILPRPGESS